MPAVADEIHGATRISENGFDRTAGAHAGFGDCRNGKHILKMRGVAGAGINGAFGFFRRSVRVGDEGHDRLFD